MLSQRIGYFGLYGKHENAEKKKTEKKFKGTNKFQN